MRHEEDQIALYCLGRIHQFIKDYAESSHISSYVLEQRVAELLYANQNGSQRGTETGMPVLRRASASRSERLEQMEMANRPRSRSTPHWTQLSENRKKLMKHVSQMWAARRKKHAPSTMKGYSYQGKHWTQRPENKARLRAIQIKIHKAKGHKMHAER